MKKFDFDSLMNASAEELSGLVPQGIYQGVCVEACMHYNEVDITDEKNQATGEKEIVTSIAFSFEVLLEDGSIAVIDSKSMPVMYANGATAKIHSTQSNLGKFFLQWSGGKKGRDLDSWFISYKSMVNRNVYLTVSHAESAKKTRYAEIGGISEMTALPGQQLPPKLGASPSYVPYIERNKNFFKMQDGELVRSFGKQEEAPATEEVKTVNLGKAGNSRTGRQAPKPTSSVEAPTDDKIPF